MPTSSHRSLFALSLLGGLTLACDLPGAEPDEPNPPGTATTEEAGTTGEPTTGTDTSTAESTTDAADSTAGTETDDPPEHPAIESMGLGGYGTCAVFEAGTSLCWGVTDFEPIGDDEPAWAGAPFLDEALVQISRTMSMDTGDWSLALLVGGAVHSYETVELDVPVTQLSTGALHACARLETGAVRCWGNGEAWEGQLGTGDCHVEAQDCEASLETAVDIDFGGSAVHVVTGRASTCVLTDLGTVRCWGENGALGNLHPEDNLGDDEVPAVADDVDVGGTVVQLVAGWSHRCALLDTGAVRCWGEGGLGYGHTETIGDDEPPAVAGDVDVGADVVELAAGSDHTCALTTAGTVRCWGSNVWGQLGYGDCMAADAYDSSCDVGDDETPASKGDVDVGGVVTRIFAGRDHTCALLDTGALRCWGANYYGQLGYGTCVSRDWYDDLTCSIGDDETPASAGDVPLFQE